MKNESLDKKPARISNKKKDKIVKVSTADSGVEQTTQRLQS